MSGSQGQRDQGVPEDDDDAPSAHVRRRFSLIWLIPIVAAVIATYLSWQTLSRRGPEITLTFISGDGMTAGQTQVRHKAVQLGTVTGIRLSPDLNHVIVTIAMTKDAEPYLTENARFWVVRPRLSGGNISGVETLLSGAYIEMDPGVSGKETRVAFTGLERPPAVRSGEPGTTFTLLAGRLGSLGPGSPVFYRDVPVGEVLDYNIQGENGNGEGPVPIQVFVRAPFDGYVRQSTKFWNASGVTVQLGADGFRVELASLQSVLSGGIAFFTYREARDAPKVTSADRFRLFRNQSDAESSGYSERLSFVTYLSSSVRGLAVGAPVEFFGIQIGVVTSVDLRVDSKVGDARVRIGFEIEPERITEIETGPRVPPREVAERMVARGARAQLRTASYLTGQMVLALDFVANAEPASITTEGNDVVIPSVNGGIDGILAAASGIAAKLDRLPLESIAASLNDTLQAARDTIAGPEVKGALRSLNSTLASADSLVRHADAGITPLMRRLPEITRSLEELVARSGRTVGGIDAAYGNNSQFQRELERAMAQVGDTARSIRLLADFLDRHPEALIRGRAGVSSQR